MAETQMKNGTRSFMGTMAGPVFYIGTRGTEVHGGEERVDDGWFQRTGGTEENQEDGLECSSG